MNIEFWDHVKSSCIKKFSPLYFTVGMVEEIAELEEQLAMDVIDEDQVISEVGDVCWYIYGLANSLEDIFPVGVQASSEETMPSTTDMLLASGKLCGSIKKWSRGDQGWEEFKKRIQGQVSLVMNLLVRRVGPYCSLEEAMKGNIVKILSRRAKGTVKGDGNNR